MGRDTLFSSTMLRSAVIKQVLWVARIFGPILVGLSILYHLQFTYSTRYLYLHHLKIHPRISCVMRKGSQRVLMDSTEPLRGVLLLYIYCQKFAVTVKRPKLQYIWWFRAKSASWGRDLLLTKAGYLKLRLTSSTSSRQRTFPQILCERFKSKYRSWFIMNSKVSPSLNRKRRR
jgi:hypothetical protein